MSETNQPTLPELIEQFQADVNQISVEEVYPLPDLSDRINHNAKYAKTGVILEPGLYLDSAETLSKSTHEPDTSLWFQPQPAHRLTREDSHNKVFFGRLGIVPEENTDSHIQIAVKSMDNSRAERLTGELAMFQYIGRLSLSTFRPAGFLVGEKASHLLTYFDGPVATMDTVDWQKMTQEEAWSELGKAVDTLTFLHSNMLFHGDPWFRNIAFDETGDTVIIDPELTSSAQELFAMLSGAGMLLDPEEKSALITLVNRMSHDFTNVCSSINQHIMPLLPKGERPRTDEAKFKLYKRHLFEPYKARIKEVDEPTRSVLLRVFDEMMVRKKEQARRGILISS